MCLGGQSEYKDALEALDTLARGTVSRLPPGRIDRGNSMRKIEESQESAEVSRLAERVSDLENAVAGLKMAKGELEAQVQIKTHLLSNISHELRALLVAIRGYTKMVLEERAGQINNVQREYLTIAFENANRLVGLVKNSLRFIADEQLRLQSFDLRELWQQSLQWMQPRALERSIRITERIPSEPFLIVGDKEKLGLVFRDLLGNALKFTDSGGEITMEFSRGKDQELAVKISDTGVGIPPELLDQVFSHYYHAPLASSDQSDTERVGLPMVHDIIWLHGGRISVTSKLGEGTTFVITLPVLRMEQKEASPNESARNPRR